MGGHALEEENDPMVPLFITGTIKAMLQSKWMQ